MVNDPGADPRPGRAARRPDRRRSPRSARFEDLRENVRVDLEADARELSRPQGGHRHPRAARQPARSDRRGVRSRLLRDGVLGPGTLPPNEESSRLAVDPQGGRAAAAARLVPRERVVPERIVKPDGPVYQEFCAAFTSPRIGQILFGLIADQLDGTPTLIIRGRGHRPASRRGAEPASPTITTPYTRGEVLVEQGQTIGEEQLILLRLEHDAAVARARFRRPGPARCSGSSRWSPRSSS